MAKVIRKALLFLILFPVSVFGYHVLNFSKGSGYVFSAWDNTPVDFRVDGGDLGGDDGMAIVEEACQEWNSIDDVIDICGDLTPISQDITLSNFDSIVFFGDSKNDIVFDETGDILLDLLGIDGILGVGITQTNTSTGEIVDAVLIINGSIPSSKTADLLSTTVHEFGHVWGLAHTPIGGITTPSSFPAGLEPISPSAIPTMYPFNNPENDEYGRTLELDDIIPMKILYPENQ